MFDFQYYTPTKVVFGEDAELQCGTLVKEFGGTRVLLHYGGGHAVRSGLLDRVKASLTASGIAFTELGGVQPNPRLSLVREGIRLGLEEKIDFLLAVGGGSVIDSAKAIAYGLGEPEKDVWELYAYTRRAARRLPVGAVLTIAAAGSEMSDSSVITNEATGEKRSYNDDLCRPVFACMNPALTLSLPDYQSMAGCADIMMHTMERYFTQGDILELTDELAEGLLRTVMESARVLHKDPGNLKARSEVMWASSLAHNGLTGCSHPGRDFATHKLEHELSGMFDVTHGAGLTALWGTWARYVMADCLPRFTRFAEKVTGAVREPGMRDTELALSGILKMEAFYREIGMPTSLKELGIAPTEEQFRRLAEDCARAAGGGPIGNAKLLDQKDMEAIYRGAAGTP